MPFEGAERLIENRIREAIEAGKFKDLPGVGKPLKLDDPGGFDRENWFANRLLKNEGVLPAWIELAKEIDAAGDQLEALLAEYEDWLARTRESLDGASKREVERRRAGVAAVYKRYFGRYRQQMSELQTMKQRFNYLVPVRSLEKAWPPLDHALGRMRARFLEALGAHFDAVPSDPPLAVERPVEPRLTAGRTVMPRAPRARRRFLRRIAEVANLVAAAK